MSDDETIEKLLQMRNLYDDENGEMYIALTRAIKAIRETSAEWVPLEKQMPELNQKVMLTVEHYDGERFIEVAYYDAHKSVNSNWETYDMAPIWEPAVAWRPLPEPYRGKENARF